MAGMPVTIRLLDPPLHEFMPDRFELVEHVTAARLNGTADMPPAGADRVSAGVPRSRDCDSTDPPAPALRHADGRE
jgi:pyruvate, orthophosphate dikinase